MASHRRKSSSPLDQSSTKGFTRTSSYFSDYTIKPRTIVVTLMNEKTNSKTASVIRYINILILFIALIWYLISRGIYYLTAIGDPILLGWHFRAISVLITLLALINFAFAYLQKDATLYRYTLFLFIAMFFGTLGDFILGGVFPLPGEPLIFGILAFGVGHIFYLLALRDLSPLLIVRKTDANSPNQRSYSLMTRNFIIWLSFMIGLTILFIFTIYNPTELTISIGVLGYGLLFGSVLAFALTKWFNDLSVTFRISLFLGFLLFFISDYILIINLLTVPVLFSTLFIHLTYLTGQLLVQLTPLFKR